MHDAVLIWAPLERLEADVAATRTAMAEEVSRVVLGGFEPAAAVLTGDV